MTARSGACRLPPDQRMRYWRPAEALGGLVSGYHLYAVQTPRATLHRDVFQPAWANLRLTLSPGTQWRVRIGADSWTAVEPCALFGPSSAVTWSESDSGIVVGAGITPRGWSRLTALPAARMANRLGSCDEVFGKGLESLRQLLCEADTDAALVPILDAFLLGAMGRPNRLDAAIERCAAALVDPTVANVATLAERVGVTARSLERLAERAFGFPPKLLLRRARFLRSLHAIRAEEPAKRATAIDPGYTDYSHFVRDAHEFLGMSPQAFLKLNNPLFVQSAQLRSEILGAPAQALGTR